MIFRQVENNHEIEIFRRGLNTAFFQRQNEKIPYFELDLDKLKGANVLLYKVEKEGEIIGGGGIEREDDHAIICHVWSRPDVQRQGVGSFLMDNLEKECRKLNLNYILLSVASEYLPARKLYESKGYRKYSKYAYVANSHFSIEMIKILQRGSVKSIRLHWIISCIKFALLFKNDSSPKLLHKLLYGEEP